MEINNIEIYFTIQEDKPLETILNSYAEKIIKSLRIPFPVLLTITITDNCEIKGINKETRNIDEKTDILSFPMLEYSKPEVLLNKLADSDFDMESGQVVLGDIVISKEQVEAQAKEYGNHFEVEILYLTIHGILHLLGYDHMNEEDKKAMRVREEEIYQMVKV